MALVSDLERRARAVLDDVAWQYLVGGAGEESTLRHNLAAFDAWELLPRALTGAGPPSTSRHVLGSPVALPVLAAPFGADRLFHPDGQIAVALGCQTAGTAAVVPASSAYSFEAVARAAPRAARIAQIHPAGTICDFRRLVRQIRDLGYSYLCVTVDTPTRGWRERSAEVEALHDPQLRNANYDDAPGGFISQLRRQSVATWTWEQLAEGLDGSELPLAIKGLISPADARPAIAIGADALIVSNHGGRQLDGTPPSLTMLPEFVAIAKPANVEVLVDSGFRRASHVIKALCLGADAVLVGRLVAFALAVGGSEGVARMFDSLQEEMVNVMSQLGVATIEELDQRFVRRRIDSSLT